MKIRDVYKRQVYGLVLNFNALHVLTANIQDAVYLRIKKCGGIIMGNSFHFAFVQKKSSLDQRLSVTGGTGVGNMCLFGKLFVDLLNRADCCFQRISVITAVKRIKKSSRCV